MDIAKAGKITGKNKYLDKGRQVYAFAAGTQKLYDYLEHNPGVMGAPVDYTNDVRSHCRSWTTSSPSTTPWTWTCSAR